MPETVPTVTMTVAVCVRASPLIVAETVFDSATVELSIPVATPLALVGPAGCVRVLAVPVAASTTVAPLMGLPNPSRAVTVTVEVPSPAWISDVAVIVERAAETPSAVTTTGAVCVTATVLIVADTVFASASVELSVPLATPLAFVVPIGCVMVLPVPVAASTTVAPLIGLPAASRAVTVIVDWLAPLEALIGEVAATLDRSADTAPAVTTSVAVCVTATALIAADAVFDSATVELSVPVATPLALVGPVGCVRVLPVPVAASTTVAPAIGFLNPSWAVTVIVEVALPAAIGDVAVMVDCAPEIAPAVTTTVPVWVTATVLIVADTLFDSATVELRVPVATPLALVTVTGWVSVFPAPVAASATVAPLTAFPAASRAVTVMVDWLAPLDAVTGDVAVTVD